jgi:rare lipoprotein A
MLATIVVLLMPSPANAAIASCYGPGLYGNPMANGVTLHRHTRGIAHRTLPMGMRLEVRIGTLRTIARITDRGPFIHNRQLDLTEAVVQRLGYHSCTAFGVRSVRTRRAR